jgi:hypothetical protein
MGYLIEISEKKVNKLSDHIEESLKHLGKAMQCVSEWMEEGEGYGERNDYRGGSYGDRGRYGNRYDGMNYRGGSMGYREDDDDEWERDEMMGERRGRRRRDSMGRYR